MISFENDYIQGAHPEVLKRLTETNLEPLSGYGTDPYCESARKRSEESADVRRQRSIFWWAGPRRMRS